MSNASAERHLRLIADELIMGGADQTLADRLYGLSDLAAIGRGFVVMEVLSATTVAEVIGGARDAIALRTADDPDLPHMPDPSELLIGAAAPAVPAAMPRIVAVGREVWAPPWDPFTLTTVELWPDHGVVRYVAGATDGSGHRPVAAIEMRGADGDLFTVRHRTTWLDGVSSAWEFVPSATAATTSLEITVAGMLEGVSVDVGERAFAKSADALASGVLDAIGYVELIVEQELAAVAREGHGRVALARRAVAAIANAFAYADLIDGAAVSRGLDAALADAGYLPAPPDGLVGRFDWVGLALGGRPTASHAALRRIATGPAAVVLDGQDVLVLSLEDWTTHSVVHAVDPGRASASDRWWRLSAEDGSRAVGRVVEPSRRDSSAFVDVEFDPGVDATAGPVVLTVGAGAKWSSVTFDPGRPR